MPMFKDLDMFDVFMWCVLAELAIWGALIFGAGVLVGVALAVCVF